jgi:uncharacterized protein YndB with AHSA1/START domain
MPEPTILHNTFAIERSFSAPPERVFSAFSDPAKKRRWFVEGPNKEIDSYELDFRPDGTERVVHRYQQGTPYPDANFTNLANYQVIDPGKRIVFANTMTIGSHCISAALVTFELIPTDTGTDLVCTHQGAFFEGSDGPQIREMGWRKLLDRLAEALQDL